MSTSTTLIIGGSSGLGFELAQRFSKTNSVIVTGRRDPQDSDINFISLDLNTSDMLAKSLDNFVEKLPHINNLVYAAGFFQEARLSDLSDQEINNMISVGLAAPTLILQRLLKKQNQLHGFIAITSSSQYTPRLLEPVYTAVKAGLGMLAHSLSLDERIDKVLVAAPSGMKTRFYENSGRDTTGMLDPSWVADQIMEHYTPEFRCKNIRLLRGPARVEVVE